MVSGCRSSAPFSGCNKMYGISLRVNHLLRCFAICCSILFRTVQPANQKKPLISALLGYIGRLFGYSMLYTCKHQRFTFSDFYTYKQTSAYTSFTIMNSPSIDKYNVEQRAGLMGGEVIRGPNMRTISRKSINLLLNQGILTFRWKKTSFLSLEGPADQRV